ncbi:C1 family peptidase, partial [Jeotgalibacillus marinus]
GHTDVTPNSEVSLMNVVAKQPVAVSLKFGSADFQHYKGGVFNGQCGPRLSHAVTVVGYGEKSLNGPKYWIVKNSWGLNWG